MTQVVTFGVIIAAALCFIGLERRFPYQPGQKFFRRGFSLDLVWYTLVQSYVLGILISVLLQKVDRETGWSQRGVISGLPVWAQVLFFFVSHDLYIYLFHRLQHRWPPLWRLHEAHHSPHDVDWLSGARSHPLEILINQTIEFAPIVLLGAAPEVAAIKGTLDAVWGMYIHSNIDVRSGWLQKVFNGPEMHRWHHAPELAIPGKNFATKLALWDWLFGTAYLPAGKPRSYGLVAIDDAPFPHDGGRLITRLPEWLAKVGSPAVAYLRQTFYAFRLPSKALPLLDPPSLVESAGVNRGGGAGVGK